MERDADPLDSIYVGSIPKFRLLDAILFERDVVIIGASPPHEKLSNKDDILAMQDLYNRMTGPVAIEKWDSDVSYIPFFDVSEPEALRYRTARFLVFAVSQCSHSVIP